MMKRFLFWCALIFLCCPYALRAEDGYRLWLRYDRVTDDTQRAAYATALGEIVFATPSGADSATLKIARDELAVALDGLLGIKPTITLSAVPSANLGDDGYSLQSSA